MKKYSVIILAAIFLAAAQTSITYAETALAPDFTLKDMSGNDVTLSSFKGTHVLLNFWATWCPYCRKERAHLNELYRAYKDKGLVVLSVSTDRSTEKVKMFLKDSPSDFTVLSDNKGRVASQYRVGGLPTSLLIDSKGIIKQKLMGYREWTNSSSRELIDRFLN